MGHGSHEVYISHPSRQNVPIFAAARRMQFTSAWAVGSLSRVTLFDASATISPFCAMTAPNGPPPFLTLSSDRAIALRMSSFLSIIVVFMSIPFRNVLFMFL